MAYNPYSAYSRRGDEIDDGGRQALLDALDEPPPMQARPRTPVRTPQQTREILSGPGGRTTVAPDTGDVGGNTYSGPERQDEPVYQPPATTPAQTGAQPRGADPFQSNMSRGYQLMDNYDDPYARRNEGSGGAGSGALKGLSYGSAAGPVGMGVGALVGAIGGAFTKNSQTARTDFAIDDARDIISQAHEDAFGRPITPEYLDQIVRGQGWEDGDRWMGQDSLAYVLDAFASQAPEDRARTASEAAAAAAATPAATTTAQAGAGGPGRYAAEGFDLQRAQDPSFSVKDAFIAAAQNAPEPPPGENKAALGEWFTKHVQPLIEAQGHTVNWVDGDKVNITGPQGTGTTDWYRGAGAAGGALAWQPEDGGGASEGGTINGTSGATTREAAYTWLKQNADPSWTRDQMQAAINAAFADVPGFVEGYAGDAVFEDGKLDLVTNFEGPGASWSDNLSLIPLHGGGTPAGAGAGGTNTGLNLSSLAPGVQLAAPLGRSDVNQKIMEELQRIMSGAPPRDELLEALG